MGSVISALAEQTRSNKRNAPKHIPYRDSVLTLLLKDSLGGNSKTIMIAAISPADCNYSETISTLRYANRAKNIINKPKINEDPNVKLIRELREEIQKLNAKLSVSGDIFDRQNSEVVAAKMHEDLIKKQTQEEFLTKEWSMKWKEAQSILNEQNGCLDLRKAGTGVLLDSNEPHLTGIPDDCSTGMMLYTLREGDTFIGSEDHSDRESFQQRFSYSIVLPGMYIMAEHCTIRLRAGNAVIIPQPDAPCELNFKSIDEPRTLKQGDMILLGRTNMFRYNDPAGAAALRELPSAIRMSESKWMYSSREQLHITNMNRYVVKTIALAIVLDGVQTNCIFFRSSESNRSILLDSDTKARDNLQQLLKTIDVELQQLNIVSLFTGRIDNLNSLNYFSIRKRCKFGIILLL